MQQRQSNSMLNSGTADRYWRCKCSHCGPFVAGHPKRYQNHFLAPKRYKTYPFYFYMEVLLGHS